MHEHCGYGIHGFIGVNVTGSFWTQSLAITFAYDPQTLTIHINVSSKLLNNIPNGRLPTG
jgi:hypothetical protein